jgi:hypothetical protein
MASDTQSIDNPVAELSPAPELRQFDRFIGGCRSVSSHLYGQVETGLLWPHRPIRCRACLRHSDRRLVDPFA